MERFRGSLKNAALLSTHRNLKKPDLYRLSERLSPVQSGMSITGGTLLCLFFSWLFYRALLPGILLLPAFLYYYLKRAGKKQFERKKQALRRDFKELAAMLSSLLTVGYSIENAMRKAEQQMIAAGGAEKDMTVMLSCMLREIEMGESTEVVWMHFAGQVQIEEIQDFGQIFSLSKRSGASLSDVLRRVVGQLELKIQTEAQIETQLAGKQAEQKVMNLMPAGILLYVCVTSPDMMQVMYTTLHGRMIMTVCLGIYIGAFYLAERMIASLR